MKYFISILALALVAAAAALLWPRSENNFYMEVSLNDTAPTQTVSAALSAPNTTPKPPLIPPTVVAAAPLATTATQISAPATLTRGSNNQIEVDGRYTILGSGTELDPYRVTWELLKSAHENMDLNGPRATPPKRLEMLNGTYVQISGYLAPPLWGHETKELLVLFNRWDGCCIGLPPTPFDCIEAQLGAPMKLGAAHTISYGTIRGKFIVEPFKAGTFLIGLYRLEEAQTDDTKPRN
ncbi:MAG: hypothetical protein EXS12_04570 [Phycisphaerales bacterium]|nr:hypothetical protein [Phycisphaerales bacterium]